MTMNCCGNCNKSLEFKNSKICTMDGKPIINVRGYCKFHKVHRKQASMNSRNHRIEKLT